MYLLLICIDFYIIFIEFAYKSFKSPLAPPWAPPWAPGSLRPPIGLPSAPHRPPWDPLGRPPMGPPLGYPRGTAVGPGPPNIWGPRAPFPEKKIRAPARIFFFYTGAPGPPQINQLINSGAPGAPK